MKKVISLTIVMSAMMSTAFANNAMNNMDSNDTSAKTTTTATETTTATTTATTAPTEWNGRLFDIMPRNTKVTAEWCKAHVPDTYKTTSKMVEKEITATNGVVAKNMTHSVNQLGGIYSIKGSAMFTGTEDGKEWKQKVMFYGYMLDKQTTERGAWYSEDCKGFYEVGPA